MKDLGRFLWLITGLTLGAGGIWFYLHSSRPVFAANDRHEDDLLCTGTVTLHPFRPMDGVWLLDRVRLHAAGRSDEQHERQRGARDRRNPHANG